MAELDLLGQIAARVQLRPGVAIGIGDDAAVLADDPPTVATHDLLVEGVHFPASSDPHDVGHKALAVNLSDLAAMGADPVAALVGLGLPEGGAGGEELMAGVEALAARVGATVAGGDLTAAPCLLVAVTALGRLPLGAAPVRRSGAQPGDWICVTGAVGGAAAALLALERPDAAVSLPPETMRRLRRPQPRLAEGRLLREAGAHAMLDVSDGVGLDALRLARASGVVAEIELDLLPLGPGVTEMAAAADRDAGLLAATGGDDYELLVALPAATANAVGPRLPAGLTRVGRIAEGHPRLRLLRGGSEVTPERLGWEHDV